MLINIFQHLFFLFFFDADGSSAVVDGVLYCLLLECLRTLGAEDTRKCLDLHCVMVSICGGEDPPRWIYPTTLCGA